MPQLKEFDPTSIGAVPVNDFDPTSIGAKPVLGTTIPEESKSIGGFISNVASSGLDLGKDIVNTIIHPVETIKGVGNVIMGTAMNTMPNTFNTPAERQVRDLLKQKYGPYSTALVDSLKERYGGWDNIVNTAYKDPAGFASDISILFSGGAGGLKGLKYAAEAGKMSKTAETLGTLGKTSGKIAGYVDPLQAPIKVGKLITPTSQINKVAERLYESALKPSKTKKNLPNISRQVQTGLENKIPVSQAGADKISSLVDGLNKEIDDLIKSKPGATVSPTKVASRADDMIPEWKAQVNPASDRSAIKKSKKEFLKEHQVRLTPTSAPLDIPIPVEEAQAIKKGTYVQLRKKYGELGSAQIETQKNLARGLKEEIANIFPEVSELNAKEGSLISLDGEMERAVARIRSHQIFGIGTPLAASGMHAVTGSNKVALAAGILRGVIDNPAMKSRLAIAIYKGSAKNPTKYGRTTLATATARVNSYLEELQQYLDQTTSDDKK